jgi:transposase
VCRLSVAGIDEAIDALMRPATEKRQGTKSRSVVQRRITRWEHEHLLEVVQKRLDKNPQAMRQRRETVEHPFGTLKMRMGATHFLMKRLPKVATEMALHVLAYNLTRVMNIMGIQPLIAAMRA